MNNLHHKPNYFVRLLIFLLCVFLAGMIAYKFLCVEPRGIIDSGVLIIIGFIVVLVLSETFDNFSVGKILTISRVVKKQEKEIEKLEKQNENLLAQVVSVSAVQNQNQSHLNVYGDYHMGPPAVTPATPEEVEQKNESEEVTSQTGQAASSAPQPPRPSINWRKAEETALNRYIDDKRISRESVISEAKLTNQFDGVDPISTHFVIFDAFMKSADGDVFVEFRPERYASPMYRDRLYVMLSKVNHYRQVKKIKAHLELVLMKLPDGEPPRYTTSRLLDNFAPAIASGLLRVMEIEFTAEETEEMRARQ
jgi:hypothetical protein